MKGPEAKALHLSSLSKVIDTGEWIAVKEEMEDLLIKEYEKFSMCKTLEDFQSIQANIYALQKVTGIDSVMAAIARRRQKI